MPSWRSSAPGWQVYCDRGPYAAAGGNFLDTANKYHGGETEQIVGRWLSAAEGRRDRTVVATKYTLSMDHADPNASGNQRKNLIRSVEASLKRLQTDYIDLLWVHAWDDYTPYEETMRALGQGYRYLPIVGARKVEQIADTLGACAVQLDDAQRAKLDEVSKISLGFPHDFLAAAPVRDLVRGEIRGRIDGRPKSG